jgi:hypothetical protein
MFEAYASDLPVAVRVFHEVEAAHSWLGEPSEPDGSEDAR